MKKENNLQANKKNLYKNSNYKLLLFPCGSFVKTKYGSIEGMITAQLIRFDKVQYEMSYFIEGDLKTIWINEYEFETNVKKYLIGFK